MANQTYGARIMAIASTVDRAAAGQLAAEILFDALTLQLADRPGYQELYMDSRGGITFHDLRADPRTGALPIVAEVAERRALLAELAPSFAELDHRERPRAWRPGE